MQCINEILYREILIIIKLKWENKSKLLIVEDEDMEEQHSILKDQFNQFGLMLRLVLNPIMKELHQKFKSLLFKMEKAK